VATIEELFEGWAKTFQDHGIVFTLGSKPTKRRDARASSKLLVNTGFVLEVIAFERFKLDSDFFL
jgi:hypothetical protein